MNQSDLQKVAAKLPLSKSVLARNVDPECQRIMAEDRAAGRKEFHAGHGAKRIRQSIKPLLNKLETECLTWLERRYAGEKIYKQAMRFRLANGVWYKPDLAMFMVLPSYEDRRLFCWECKGPREVKGCSKGIMTVKIAASEYPEIWWRLLWKENGQIKEQAVLP